MDNEKAENSLAVVSVTMSPELAQRARCKPRLQVCRDPHISATRLSTT